MGNGVSPEHPALLLILLAASVVVFRWWRADGAALARGEPLARPLPGTGPAPARAIGLAIAGALLLVALETAGEYQLGISTEQRDVTVLFGLYTLAAAFLEELIFRGHLVVDRRGRGPLLLSLGLASLLFALLHPFLWAWENGTLVWLGGRKGWFSTGAVFLASLWFYTVRFWPLNPGRSLWPCIAAHGAKNLAVLGVKAAQGHVTGWW